MVIRSKPTEKGNRNFKTSLKIDSASLRAFLGTINTIALGEITRSERALQSLEHLSMRLRCDSAEDVLQRNERPHEL